MLLSVEPGDLDERLGIITNWYHNSVEQDAYVRN